MDNSSHGPLGETFEFGGFEIPTELAVLTGGGVETWESISAEHRAAYERYSPIREGQRILEVGCGVGRDAIPLIEVVGSDGSYLGVDIIAESIKWCQDHITRQYPNAVFEHFDIQSDFYNPSGALKTSDVTFPVEDGQIDRIILQSVFTHMFEDDIVHFLSEFRRVLRLDGLVFATFFVLDDESLQLSSQSGGTLTFSHPWSNGCRIVDIKNPEGAVGYTPEALNRMLSNSGLTLDQPVHHGYWSGRQGAVDGQDIAILRRSTPPA